MKEQIKDLKQKIQDLVKARKTILWSVDILPSKEEEQRGYNAAQAVNEMINGYIRELEALEKIKASREAKK